MFYRLSILLPLGFSLILLNSVAWASDVWNVDISFPKNDSRWLEVERLWHNHWQEDDVSELIKVLGSMEQDKAGVEADNHSVELYLWLSKAYYLSARYNSKGRLDALKQSEDYAVKALATDPDNVVGKKLLVTAVVSYADKTYMEKKYSHFLIDALPIKEERALPILRDNPQFMSVLPAWDSREILERAVQAVNTFTDIANNNSKLSLAQLWVCRGNYYLGYYYIGVKQLDTSLGYFKKGVDYCQRAIKLTPNDVFARYWYQLNLSRVIQNASMLKKARYINEITGHLVFTANENMTYFYNSPTSSLATLLENGGWIVEKGLEMEGYTVDMLRNASEISVYAFPTYFYTYFARAKLLYRDGRKDEARTILESTLKMDPQVNPYHAAENIIVKKLIHAYLEEYFQ